MVTRIENFIRYLSFDDEYLEMGPSVPDPIGEYLQTRSDPRSVLQLMSLAYGAIKLSEEFESIKNRKLAEIVLEPSRIRLEFIDSVKFSTNDGELAKQSKPFVQVARMIPGVNALAGKINPAAYDTAGRIVVTTSAATDRPFELMVHQSDVELAQNFVSNLENKIKDLGRKVQIVGMNASPNSGNDDEQKICPDCAEKIRAAARKCRFCGYEYYPAS